MSRSLRNAAQELLLHAPYVEQTSSIVKLCRTVVKRPDLGLAIRVLPVWDFGHLDQLTSQCLVLSMVHILEHHDLPVTPELRKEQLAELEGSQYRAYETERRGRLPFDPDSCAQRIPIWLHAYAMDMVVKMAKRAHCFYAVRCPWLRGIVASSTLKPLINLRECYLFLREADQFSISITVYNNTLSALFQSCPQLSVLGLQIDLDATHGINSNTIPIAADDNIPITRLELRCLPKTWWRKVHLEPLLAYFQNAPNLSEIYCLLIPRHKSKPEIPDTPFSDVFPGLLPIMDNFTLNMTTAAKNRIRRLAFLNPGITHGDWQAMPDDNRMLAGMDATEENLSFRRHFPNLEVLDVSAYFAYQSSALSTFPHGVKEVRIHDSVPNVATVLAQDTIQLIGRRAQTEGNGSPDHVGPVIFANSDHASRAVSYLEELDDETKVDDGLALGDTLGRWLLAMSSVQLERDLRGLP